ncbi:MAG: hypothetical protein N3G20_02795 [Verrucomicrobiae bacterium]|nr:hypothetical protein [Verrucomicrobiae bacterium]
MISSQGTAIKQSSKTFAHCDGSDLQPVPGSTGTYLEYYVTIGLLRPAITQGLFIAEVMVPAASHLPIQQSSSQTGCSHQLNNRAADVTRNIRHGSHCVPELITSPVEGNWHLKTASMFLFSFTIDEIELC